ncbi:MULTISPECIES: non-homologous end joining protein Ku [Brevibacillus]|uniref:Non-homologous end joining protein Ku n=1 Tax=Brevibacillus borstelensis AK1 TaxID=1300222 RepID=M8EFS0_9BACL|nr:Ku protein [Brevibacillus borstelensis]EMT54325.1 YkoV protein [Brevibacillus borstelensis AK1]KKX54071.1 DNA repair protein [Brevibacillus borstelensis cifa_chp40]MBE5398101.1 Ku protein [Brevibacillus borstelensis]MCC0564656.1 Ku protein [Brevibacillus borstelensis]MCM3470125.1 Ku protein [Brevibacillus borstelensis]
MHTVWKGSISFGLVNIPVRMFTATEERDVRFRQLHKECHTPIRYTKMCPHCEKEVGAEDIVRGFEYEKGNYVIIQDEDLEAITPETRRAIEIVDFVDLTEIDPVYFDKSYFLSPQETGDKAYSLLRAAMKETGKIAIARVTMRNKESLAVIRLYEHCIMMETIFYPDEVRPVAQVPALPEADVALAENELRMAAELINNMTTAFEPGKYKDEYRSSLQALIEKKKEGKEIAVAPAAPRANVVDLMQALRESLAATGDQATPAKLEPHPTPAPPAGVKKQPGIKPERKSPEKPTAATTTTKKLRRKKAETS